MKCPFCSSEEIRVIDTRDSEAATRRRRECCKCGKRFTTYERIESAELVIVKKDKRREPFSREKLLTGIARACEKRPVSSEEIAQLVEDIEAKLRNENSAEIPSEVVGELVIRKLKQLDKVAYIRFASVYRDFDDVKDFAKEVRAIKK